MELDNALQQTPVAQHERDTRHLAIKNFPFLTQEEFRDACHYLDRRYTQATLGSIRSQFALSIHNVAFSDTLTWARIVKPIILSQADDNELSNALDNLSWGVAGGSQVDTQMDGADGENRKLMDIGAEDADMHMVRTGRGVHKFLSKCLSPL